MHYFRTWLRPALIVSAWHMADPQKGRWRCWWAWALFAGVWLLVCRNLAVHWSVNPVYSYGWLVPAFGLYAALGRWKTRPVPGPAWRLGGVLAGAAAFAFFPTWLFAQPSPDWSLCGWLLTAEVVVMTLGVVAWIGGWPWLRHFAFPICFIFAAVPCPRVIEVPLTHRLMRSVAGVTVEILTIAGVAAVQHGNVIEVKSGLLGVDEACSGVRSLQAALMGALFLGELFRFGWRRRVLLLAVGLVAALVTNVARTFFLAWNAANEGLEAVGRWHDPAGFVILTLCLIFVWLAGLHLSRNDHPVAVVRDVPVAHRLPIGFLAGLSVWFLATLAITEWWFHDDGHPPESQWSLVPLTGSTPVEIGPVAAEQLRCDATTAATWKELDGGRWTMFFFEWGPGPTASRVLAGTHRPEICLSAIGMKLAEDRGAIEIQPAGIPLRFHAYTFEQEGRPVFVYYGIWQIRRPRSSLQGTLSESPHRASVQAVLWRERNLGQQVAELVVSGYTSAAQADAAFEEAMDKLLIARVPSTLIPP
jgi:exosortase